MIGGKYREEKEHYPGSQLFIGVCLLFRVGFPCIRHGWRFVLNRYGAKQHILCDYGERGAVGLGRPGLLDLERK